MASSGQFTIARGCNSAKTSYFAISSNLRLVVDWSLQSQNITNNQSVIKVKLSVIHSKISLTAGSNDCSFTFGNQTISWTGPNLSRSTNSPITTILGERTVTVTHSADGSFTGNLIAEYRLSSSNGFVYGGQSFGYISNGESAYQESITLPTIARKSSMTVSGSNVGSDIVFSITSATGSNFTHDISYKYGTTTANIATSVSNSFTWSGGTNSGVLSNLCQNAPSMTITFILTTKSGSTTIGANEYSVTLSFPESSFKPILSITVTENDGRSSYIQSLSSVKVIPNATAVGNSPITSCVINIGGRSYSRTTPTQIVSSELTTAGSVGITCRVTNARGYSVETSAIITVVSYNPPVISDLIVRRVDVNGNSDISGEYAYIGFRVGISATPSDNALASTYPKGVYKLTTNSWGTSDTAISSFTLTNGIYHTQISLSADYAFNIKILVKDSYSSEISAVTTVSTAFAILHFRETGRGIGIGGISNADRLQVYMPIESSSWISGSGYWFNYGQQTGEASVIYRSDTTGSTYPHDIRASGGNPNSEIAFRLHDYRNSRNVVEYDDTEGGSLMVFGVSYPIYSQDLGSTINLNDVREHGYYIQTSSANATTSKNYPMNQMAGYLEVFHNSTQSYILQRYTAYDTTKVWIRNLYSGSWTAWRLVFGKETLSITLNPGQSYVTQTEINYMAAYRSGGNLYFTGNLGVNNMPSNSTFYQIGTISGWNAVNTIYLDIPGQSGNGVVLLVEILSSGVIQIWNGSGVVANTWFRFQVSVPENI